MNYWPLVPIPLSAYLSGGIRAAHVVKTSAYAIFGERPAVSKPTTRVDWDAWRRGILAKVQPETTALAVIDVQNDFCSDGGALAALGSDVSPCRIAAQRIADFLPRVRPLLRMVAFFRLEYDPPQMSAVQRERLLRDGRAVLCAPGSSGVGFFIEPGPTDKVFTKYRYSAFSNERFLDTLRSAPIETIAVTGVDTHICVENTVRHGYDLGYRMLVVSDLVATRKSELHRHEQSLQVAERYFGLAIDSVQLLQLLDRTPGSRSDSRD